MNVMPYEQWMQLTHGGYMSVRSSELKAIDNALRKYHQTKLPADLEALTAALLKWMQAKGAGWKTSVRNRNQAVEILYGQVTGTGGRGKLSGGEMAGLSHMRDEARAIVHDLFHGKHLRWRNDFAGKLSNNKWGVRLNVPGAVRNINTLSGGALRSGVQSAVHAIQPGGGGGHATELANDLLRSVCPTEIFGEVSGWLADYLPSFMTDLAASLTPFLGIITTGGAAAWNAKNALRGQWRLEWARHHAAGSLSHAEPAAAIAALIRILERERNADIFSFSASIAEFGGKLAGALADGGTATNAAIGLASQVAKLLNILRIVIRDVLEKNAANRQMQSQVDIAIFDISPVTGAYLICCAPTSVMVNTIFDNRFGEVGWQSEVEFAVRQHLQPLKEHARRVVLEHRFWIPQLYNFAGIVQVNEKKLKAMLENKGKTGMVGFGSDAQGAGA